MVADKAKYNDGAVYMPVEQYLLLDDNTDGQYEYWHGQVILPAHQSCITWKTTSGAAFS